ncbi:MAG: metallophosphoesterase [Cyanobacteriota bacterium]|nr:metallophosphoesterase [Cyanobacteriota bacterium]
MSSTLVIHSADWQIGKPYGRVSHPDKRSRLRQVRIEAIGRIGAHCQATRAAALVVAGDLFDAPTPAASDVSAVCAAIGAIGCPVLVIPGNHDHGGAGSLWHDPFLEAERERRAPNLQVLLERQPLELEELMVLPCPLLRRSDSADPCAWLGQLDWAALPPAKPRLVLAHGSIQSFSASDQTHSSDRDSDDENPPNANNLLRLDPNWLDQVDYVALGDWHGLKQVGAKAWYAGTPEPDRFPRHADYRAGVVLQVTLGRGQLPAVEPLATGMLGWHPLQVELHSGADVERLERQLETLLGDRVGGDLVLLEQRGSLPLQAHRRYTALLERLEAQLLRLKRRGHCREAPGEAELTALTHRPGDPLIAQVAVALQQELASRADAQELLQRALAELHRAVLQAEA